MFNVALTQKDADRISDALELLAVHYDHAGLTSARTKTVELRAKIVRASLDAPSPSEDR